MSNCSDESNQQSIPNCLLAPHLLRQVCLQLLPRRLCFLALLLRGARLQLCQGGHEAGLAACGSRKAHRYVPTMTMTKLKLRWEVQG